MKKTSILNTESLSMPISDAPNSIDVSKMSDEELKNKLLKGYKEAINGEGEPLDEFIKNFKNEHY